MDSFLPDTISLGIGTKKNPALYFNNLCRLLLKGKQNAESYMWSQRTLYVLYFLNLTFQIEFTAKISKLF